MDLTPLRTLRTRRLVDTLGTVVLVGLATGLAIVVLAVCADAFAGLPWLARVGGLGASFVACLAGAIVGGRRLVRGDWTLRGTARFAAARNAGAANALTSYLELGAAGSVPHYVADRIAAAAEREA